MALRPPLARLLQPEHIAVIGGRFAAAVIEQCGRIGYGGEIWPVNPFREKIGSRPCFPDVESLPAGPDAAFVAVSREKTIETIRALALKGAGGAVCYASGFSELGPEGARLEAQLTAAMGDLALVGPNCYGLLNYLDGVALWPDQHGGRRVTTGAAVIMQSGNMALSLTMQQRSLPLAYMISVGNLAGLKMHDYVGALLRDPRVTAIGIHLEGLDDPAAFSEVALQALRQRIPLVVLKTGVSRRGRELALSHTRSLSGSDRLFDAFCERFGLQRAGSLPEFVEMLKFLSVIGPLPTGSIASISCSGGEAALVADAAERIGVPLASLGEGQKAALRSVLGDQVVLNNPLDYHTYIWGDPRAQAECFTAMMQGDQDITLKVLDYPRPDRSDGGDWERTGRAFQEARERTGGRAAVVSTLPENFPLEERQAFLDRGIAPMQGLEECLQAVRAAAAVHRKQRMVDDVRSLRRLPALQDGGSALAEGDSKMLLSQQGIRVPRFEICDLGRAREAAGRIGFPVALKIHASEITHKSDRGGVFLNLDSESELQEALAALRELGDQVLVEEMLPPPVAELFLGLVRDRTFGLALLIGKGGLGVELEADVQALLFPVEAQHVLEALGRLKARPLLDGFRGRPPADIEAIVQTAQALAEYGQRHAAEVLEVDINPLFAMPAGQGAIAVDAVVRLAG